MDAYEKIAEMMGWLDKPRPQDSASPEYQEWWDKRSDAHDKIDRHIAIAQVEQLKRIADALENPPASTLNIDDAVIRVVKAIQELRDDDLSESVRVWGAQ